MSIDKAKAHNKQTQSERNVTMKKMMKTAGLAMAAAFQLAAGSAIVALVVHDLAIGRFHDLWNIAGAVGCGLVLGVGAIVSSIGYAALAKAVQHG